MMLYDYECGEAMDELFGMRPWTITLLPQLYELAQKYQLPHLIPSILNALKCTLKNHAANGVKDFYWQLATYLYEDEDRAREMRPILLEAFRKHAKSFVGAADWVKANLLNCPRLSIELAMSGGLDGTGMSIV